MGRGHRAELKLWFSIQQAGWNCPNPRKAFRSKAPDQSEQYHPALRPAD